MRCSDIVHHFNLFDCLLDLYIRRFDSRLYSFIFQILTWTDYGVKLKAEKFPDVKLEFSYHYCENFLRRALSNEMIPRFVVERCVSREIKRSDLNKRLLSFLSFLNLMGKIWARKKICWQNSKKTPVLTQTCFILNKSR